jgi:hypothetical protein
MRLRELGRELIKSEATAVSWLTLRMQIACACRADSVTSAKPPIADQIAAPQKSAVQGHFLP